MDTRIDCALGVELKTMRAQRQLTLMTMSIDMGWEPVKLSHYEHNIGALTDPEDARAIADYCSKQSWRLSDKAINLSNKEVVTDLTDARASFARWRNEVLESANCL